MLDKIIKYSIYHRIQILAGVLLLICVGVYATLNLSIDAVPDITNNQVQVTTVSPNLAAQEVEQYITAPLELGLANIPGKIEMRSISRLGLSVITVVFEDNVPNTLARQLITEAIRKVKGEIPVEFGKPGLSPQTTGLGEIYQYTIEQNSKNRRKLDLTELRTLQDWVIRKQLLNVKGIAEVSSFGGYVKQYEVAIDPAILLQYNLNIQDIWLALKENNENVGAAFIENNFSAYYIRGLGQIHNLEDIGNIPVKRNSLGSTLLLKDLCEIQLGKGTRYGAVTQDTLGETVGGVVMMIKGGNASEVITRIKNRVSEIQTSLPKGVTISPFIDRSKLVNKTVTTVLKNLIEGALIVIVLLILLLGSFRAGLIIASVIPLSLLFAIILMQQFGITGNLMSMGAIDFGLVVDGSVIMTEAIVAHFALLSFKGKMIKEEKLQETYFAAGQIRKAAAFGEFIILIVYIPILSLQGIEGKMFTPMALTVCFALVGAFILSLTYVPAMCAWLLRPGNDEFKLTKLINNAYTNAFSFLFRRIIRKPFIFIGFSVLLMLSSFIILFNMGGEFIPQLEEGDFAVEITMLPGTKLKTTADNFVKCAELLHRKFPEVKKIVGKVGSSEITTDPMPVENGDMIIILKDKKDWTTADNMDDLADEMKEELKKIPGIEFSFQQPIQMRFNELMTGAKQDIVIQIYGDDLDKLSTIAELFKKKIVSIEGVNEVVVEKITGLPQIQLDYNRQKLNLYGLTISDVNKSLSTAFAGMSSGLIYEEGRKFDLVVRLREDLRTDIEQIKKLPINIGNRHITLDQIANIAFIKGPAQVNRENQQRRVNVGINIGNRDAHSIVKDISLKIDKAKLPVGYYKTIGGEFRNLEKAGKRLALIIPLAILIISLIVFFTFNNFLETILVILAIPFSVIGGVLLLSARGMPFSISAAVGFIALIGISVLNGIVLISKYKQLNDTILTPIRVVYLGTLSRLRPVLMTALVASFGFLPMAISTSAGAEVQRPLATVVIGGIITSTLLTLLLIPIFYLFILKRRAK